MQAIVLAAGEGSRMRPLTSTLPKVMMPICGKPFLEHLILKARQAGADRLVLVVGYGQGFVRNYFEDGGKLGVKIEYAIQDKQLGTGHALLAAESLAEDRFAVLNGDVLPDVESLGNLISGKENAVAAMSVLDPTRYGVFLVEEGYMKSVVEKSKTPPSNLANAGIYLFDKEIFQALRKASLSERGEYELTDGLNSLASSGKKIRVVEMKGWLEIGRPWDILEANITLMAEAQQEIRGEVEAGTVLKGKVSVGEGTVIRSGAYITGPVIIGKDCDIGPNCYIRAATCIGDRVRIDSASEVKNSTIMNDTKIGCLSYVGDSVIGSNCNFGAGTVVSNLRHDRANIRSYIKGQQVDSGRVKLGAIIGDNVKTGIHTSIYPGTVVESGYRSRPGEVLRGLVSVSPPSGQRN